MPIQVLKPKFHVEECLDAVRECLEKGWTGMGFKTVEFENDWKAYTGHKNAYFINSNTVGLHLAMQILKMENGWQDGDEVITTPITFVSTNHSILSICLVGATAIVILSLQGNATSSISTTSSSVRLECGSIIRHFNLCPQPSITSIISPCCLRSTRIQCCESLSGNIGFFNMSGA